MPKTPVHAAATPDVYDNYDSVDFVQASINIDPTKLSLWANHTQEWVSKNLLSIDAALQLCIVAGCFMLGIVAGRFISVKLGQSVDHMRGPVGFKNILHKLHRLSGSVISLLLLFAALLAVSFSGLDIKTGLLDAVMRLTAAWVVIKIAVQVVRSSFMRRFIGSSVLLIAGLSIFGVLGPVVAGLEDIGITVGTFHLTLLTVIKAIFATIVMSYCALGITALIERQLEKIPAMTSGSRLLITKIIRMLLITLAIMAGATMAGVNLAMFAVFSGAIGLGVGLGLQKGVSNLFTGIMLLMDRTIQPGDIIELQNGAFGVVRQMGSRCTEIITLDEKSYLIPNEYLVSNQVINWSRSGNNIQLNIEFGVGYDQDPKEIIQIAVEAASKANRVLKSPKPSCKIKSFKEGSLEFILIFWIADAAQGVVNAKSDVQMNLWYALKNKNVTIPYNPKTIYQPVVPEIKA